MSQETSRSDCYQANAPARWQAHSFDRRTLLAPALPLLACLGCLFDRLALGNTGADIGMFMFGILTFWGSVIPLAAFGDSSHGQNRLAHRLKRWQSQVASELSYAPAWPLDGFSVVVAKQELEIEADGTSALHFVSQLKRWQEGDWEDAESIEPAEVRGLKARFEASEGVEVIAAAWFDYQQAVKLANEHRFELEFARQHSHTAAELRSTQLALNAA